MALSPRDWLLVLIPHDTRVGAAGGPPPDLVHSLAVLRARSPLAVHKPWFLAITPCACWCCVQVLHVARHLLWYTLVRPVRMGDWAGAELNAQVLLTTCLVLALAASPRGGRLWAAWRRWAGSGLLQCIY